MITIHVLAAGDLFQHVLNTIASFMKQDSFFGLLRITTLIGIVMATVGFLKTRDPMAFGRWFLAYVFFVNVVLLPKTEVLIDDITNTTEEFKKVDNVPVVFALTANLVTTIGYGLAQSYDALLSMPNDLQYTSTGALFGSRLVQASSAFRIVDPVLKEEMNDYFRSCVVGDIRLNHKYSVGDLSHSPEIWNLISAKASPLRMVTINGKSVSCLEASKAEGAYSLRKKLDAEIQKAYCFFGVNLFGKPEKTTYEALFNTRLTSAFNYYQNLTDTSSNIFLQSMMINAMKDGASHYQAFTDATAGVVNQQFTKSQVQHRWSWEVLGQKALWILPITHTCLTVLLFGVFPLILALCTLPGGFRILFGYLQFFMSLQFWPVLFAILNAGMTIYGASLSSEYGHFSMVNLDKMDEVHADISGACGYLMMLVPFLSHGLVSNLGGAFSNLATSMMSHMQGSSMSVAGEAASASFGLGQTSFYNTTANNLSANKHDTNWTNMHAMKTEQLGSGVLKTITGSGEAVFDVSPGMTKGAVSIVDAKAMSSSLNQAFEESTQAAKNESAHFQKSLSNFAHRALQLSKIAGHDMRLGDGISESESGQYSNALHTINQIAKDVANRMGISKEDALSHMISGGASTKAGFDSRRAIWGKAIKWTSGLSGGFDIHGKVERSSTSADRYHHNADKTLSAREGKDFNEAMNYIQNFAQNHHFDDNHSEAASLSNQMGSDLREAENANRNYDASLSRASRIQKAQSFVESQSDQINKNLDQAFSQFVASRIGESGRDALYSKPGDLQTLNTLQGLGQEFMASKQEAMIAEFGEGEHQKAIEGKYRQDKLQLEAKEQRIDQSYQGNSQALVHQSKALNLGIDPSQVRAIKQHNNQQSETIQQKLTQGEGMVKDKRRARMHSGMEEIAKGTIGQRNMVSPDDLPKE